MIETKTIALILVILVVALTALLLIKGDLLGWIKGLPGYEEPEGEISVEEDELITLDCEVIGFIQGDKIFLGDEKKNVGTNLLWDDDKNIIKTSSFEVIGEVIQGKLKLISIYPYFFSDEDFHIRNKISREHLFLLDHSFLYVNNKLCKAKDRIEKERGEKIEGKEYSNSNILEIVFSYSGTFIPKNPNPDKIFIYWNYNRNVPEIMLYPSLKPLKTKDEEGNEVVVGWISPKDKFYLENKNIKSKFIEEDISRIRVLLLSKNIKEFSQNLKNSLDTSRTFIEKYFKPDGSEIIIPGNTRILGGEDLDMRVVNSLLYGVQDLSKLYELRKKAMKTLTVGDKIDFANLPRNLFKPGKAASGVYSDYRGNLIYVNEKGEVVGIKNQETGWESTLPQEINIEIVPK